MQRPSPTSISYSPFDALFFKFFSRMQSLPNERKRNQRKSPLTPKKSFRKEDSPPAIAMRVGGRVKKAKIPFDPSDAVTKRRQTDSCLAMKRVGVGKDAPVVQYSCCNCKKFDKPENLVNCKGVCSAKSKSDNKTDLLSSIKFEISVHLSCLQSICENFGKNEEESWECNNCQSCTVCNRGSSNGVSCAACDFKVASSHL